MKQLIDTYESAYFVCSSCVLLPINLFSLPDWELNAFRHYHCTWGAGGRQAGRETERERRYMRTDNTLSCGRGDDDKTRRRDWTGPRDLFFYYYYYYLHDHSIGSLADVGQVRVPGRHLKELSPNCTCCCVVGCCCCCRRGRCLLLCLGHFGESVVVRSPPGVFAGRLFCFLCSERRKQTRNFPELTLC